VGGPQNGSSRCREEKNPVQFIASDCTCWAVPAPIIQKYGILNYLVRHGYELDTNSLVTVLVFKNVELGQ
jgi:hypothetical protein